MNRAMYPSSNDDTASAMTVQSSVIKSTPFNDPLLNAFNSSGIDAAGDAATNIVYTSSSLYDTAAVSAPNQHDAYISPNHNNNLDMSNLLLWCNPQQYYNTSELLQVNGLDYPQQTQSVSALLPPINQSTSVYPAYAPAYRTAASAYTTSGAPNATHFRMPSARNGFGAQKRKTGGRRPKEEEVNFHMLAPEDRDKKLKRRERNKEAAARCRQRRLDSMETLQMQVDDLKKKNKDKQMMIDELKLEKMRMQEMMNNHGQCKIPANHQFVMPSPAMEMPGRLGRVTRSSSTNVKTETDDPTLTQVAGSDVEGRQHVDRHDLQRPITLAFPHNSGAPGVAISTPSSGFTPIMTSLGQFGTTPLGMSTGLTPTNATGGFQHVVVTTSSLDTPVCGNVQRMEL